MIWSERRQRGILTALVAAAAMLLALPALAVEPEDDSGISDAMRAKIEHRIRTMRAMVLTEALDLDEATAKKLFALMDSYDAKRRKIAAERRELMEEVKRAASDPKVDHKRIDALFTKLTNNRVAEVKLNGAMGADTKTILSPAQRARLALVLPKFYRRVQKLINDAKRDMMRKAFDLE